MNQLIKIEDHDKYTTTLYFENNLACTIRWDVIDKEDTFSRYPEYWFFINEPFHSKLHGLARFKHFCEWRCSDSDDDICFPGPPSKEGYNCWKLKMLQ